MKVLKRIMHDVLIVALAIMALIAGINGETTLLVVLVMTILITFVSLCIEMLVSPLECGR